jgi:hypothetical protein
VEEMMKEKEEEEILAMQEELIKLKTSEEKYTNLCLC